MRLLLILTLFFLSGCLGEEFRLQNQTTPSPPVSSPPSSAGSNSDEETITKVVTKPPYLALEGIGSRRQLQTEITLEQPSSLPSPSAGEGVIWKSDDETIATVDTKGLVTARGTGATFIRATSGNKSGSTYLVIRETPSAASATESTTAGTPTTAEPREFVDCDPLPRTADPYADRVVSFSPGRGFSENQDLDRALGPPKGEGCCQGGHDVVNLGRGEIILELTDYEICNGDGPDLIVFENPFFVEGPNRQPTTRSFAEPARVALSQDGENFYEFPCDVSDWPFYPCCDTGVLEYHGCAGILPVFANPDENEIDPTDPTVAGGDSFDLDEIGLNSARYIRIRDAGLQAILVNGFDLDAVAVVNGRRP
ncbi:MAG: Ig-like domain-containing protein [Deltaproteobacteria bacterium]|nr:Ig-like domain-containing protein [Deltaproteobacteria bacterium]